MDFFSVLTLLGGLAMFLYGMEVMGDGLKNSSGTALKRLLERVTRNTILGLLTGMLVTAVIQSSTATIVLTAGLIGAGILDLKQSASIVMGANIGTTITAQIIRLMDIKADGNVFLQLVRPSTLAPLALIAGIVLIMFVKKRNTRSTGEIFIGFGVLFSGLMTMTASAEPLAESAAFADVLSKVSGMPLLGILAGLGFTVIVQSSSAMIGMVQALSSTGVMTFDLIYPVIMGIDLGTCITTAIVCSIGSNTDAKRTGVVHILFNCIGTILFMIAMTILKSAGAFPSLWGSVVNSGGIANFATLFKVTTALILLPFTGLLVKAAIAIVPGAKKPEPYPEQTLLDEKLLVTPPVAMAEVGRGIAIMGKVAHDSLCKSCGLLTKYDPKVTAEILAYEDRLDSFADAADNFLIKLSRRVEGQAANDQINLLLQANTDFERIGDYATNIQEFAQKMAEENITFSEMAQKELGMMTSAIDEILNVTIQALEADDNDLAARVEPLEEVIDDMVALLRARHVERLKSGQCSVSAGLSFMDTMTFLERASDQCSSIAVLMLGRKDAAVMENHHEYLRKLHEGGDTRYDDELARRREQYLLPLQQMVAEN